MRTSRGTDQGYGRRRTNTDRSAGAGRNRPDIPPKAAESRTESVNAMWSRIADAIARVYAWPLDLMHDRFCPCGQGYGSGREYYPQNPDDIVRVEDGKDKAP